MSKKASIAIVSLTLILAITAITIGVVAFCIEEAALSYEPSIDRKPFVYSSDTAIAYKTAMTKALGVNPDMLGGLADFCDNIYTAFSSARVSEKTVLLFIEEVDSYPWEDENNEVAVFLQKFLNPEGDDKIVSLATSNDIYGALIATLMFLDKIDATADEIGRFTYQIIYHYADEEHKMLMDKTGEQNWTMLTVGTYTAIQLTAQEDAYSSLSTSRAIGQAITALGYAYNEILVDIGKDNLTKLVGLDKLEDIDESNLTNNRLEEYRACVEIIKDKFSDIFMMTGEIMKAQNTLLYEELYIYKAKLATGDTSNTHLVYAMYNLSDSIKKGIEQLKQSSSLSTDQEVLDMLAEYYAACATFADIMYSDNGKSYQSYKAEALYELSKLNQQIDILDSKNFENFYEVEEYQAQNTDGFEELIQAATALLNTDYDYGAVVTRFVYSVSIAAIVALI